MEKTNFKIGLPEEGRLSARRRSRSGFTFIEAVVYSALLGVIAVVLISFMIQILNTYNYARAEREVASNARLLMETIGKYVAESEDIYWPTSSFNNDTGQISLVSPVGAVAEHSSSYVDFWLDNGFLLMRKEGSGEKIISSASVFVDKFRVERMQQYIDRSAIRITLEVRHADAKYPSLITLASTVSMRGGY